MSSEVSTVRYRKPRLCYPINASDPVPVAAAGLASRFGGAPWVSTLASEDVLRPATAKNVPYVLIGQLALNDLPEPLPIKDLLLQVFGHQVYEKSKPRIRGIEEVYAKVVDAVPGGGHLAPVALPEDAECRLIKFGSGRMDPVGLWDPYKLDTANEDDVRTLQEDKVFGNPIAVSDELQGKLGSCGDCARPFDLLWHIEGRRFVPYAFGDGGWVAVGYCPEHVWNVKATMLQIS